MATPLAEVLEINRRRFEMARGGYGGAAAMGAATVSGTTAIGDRPGTTSVPEVSSWRGTPAGRARMIAIGAFVFLTVIHVAAETRYTG